MNQILVTGDEKVKYKKNKSTLSINSIVSFFAISLIIFGACTIGGSVYAKSKVNEIVAKNTKPTVNMFRNDDNNTVEISVSHIRPIKEITYQWNDEEVSHIKSNNEKNVKEIIPLIGGVNILKIVVTEENGENTTYERSFSVGNIPEIKLEAVSNGVKITITSEDTIKYVTYSWDSQNEEKIEINNKTYEGILNAPKGKHLLNIEAVNTQNLKAVKSQMVVGDTAPTLSVKAQVRDEKKYFIINGEDDEKISKVEITLNNNEKEIIEVNDTKYHQELEMDEGENKLIVTVYNANGLSTTLRKKSTK